MFTNRITASIAGTGLAAAALGFAALGFAGAAGASSTDSAFLAKLASDGMEVNNPTAAVGIAHGVCKSLDQGVSPQTVVNGVAQTTGLSQKSSKAFAVDAASVYCPQYVTSNGPTT